MIYQQPSVWIWGIKIDEPITTLTDLVVSAVCIYAFLKLTGHYNKSRVKNYLRFYFLGLGIATAIGGIIGHAFMYRFSFYWKLPGWVTSMVSIMLIERASIDYASPILKPLVGKWLKRINLLELAVFITITLITLRFTYVEIHSAYGLLLVVTGIHSYILITRHSPASQLFIVAVAFSSIAALIYMNEIGLSKWFTHSDLSHVFMAISAWFFYLGSKYIVQHPNLRKVTYIKKSALKTFKNSIGHFHLNS